MPTPEDKPALLADKDFGFPLSNDREYIAIIINQIEINLGF
jgi:hypothetical protein